MKGVVQYCKKCFEEPDKEIDAIKKACNWTTEYAKQYICIGYYTPDEKRIYCKYHPNEKLYDSILTIDEYLVLNKISIDYNFIQAMEELKQNNIIEFNLKMSQFKNNAQQQKNTSQTNSNTIKCPTCNSTKVKRISDTAKAAGAAAFGIFSKTARSQFKCENCGYKW
ncbi:hypothetical protein AALB16_16550 [Lachnospiraceae bacterium 62-35]